MLVEGKKSFKSATKMVTGFLRMTKVAIFIVWDKKVYLAQYEKYGSLSIYYERDSLND